MRLYEIYMNQLGNRRAGTAKDAKKCGVNEIKFDRYIQAVRSLATSCRDYVFARFEAEDEELFEIYTDQIREDFARVLRFVEKDPENPVFTVTRHDVETLAGKAETWCYAEDVGTVWTGETDDLFRKAVEAYVGFRMSPNGMLAVESREIIEAYQAAVRRIKSLTEKLEGKDDDDGNHTDGDLDVWNKLRRRIDKQTEAIYNIEVIIKGGVEGLDAILEDAKGIKEDLEAEEVKMKKAIDKAYKGIKEAKEAKDSLEVDYYNAKENLVKMTADNAR